MDFFEETKKAKNNFPIEFAYPPREFIESLFQVKLAALRVNYSLGFFEKDIFDAMEEVIVKGINGDYDDYFDLSFYQGGAGTSLNMVANEIISRFSSEKIHKKISPFEHSNKHQSTNDVIPTAVKITLMKFAEKLESSVLSLLRSLEKKEKEFDSFVKPGLTQMRFAVPITLGREFSAYSSAVSRDRWRISKIKERLKEVNLGGTAIGTGFNAPKRYIFAVVEELRKITSLPLARAENLVDVTQNADVYVEVSGILTALSSTLFKIAGDIRFLSSSPINQIVVKEVQAGSSIMPGKVNPVLAEFAQICSIRVQANHNAVQFAASCGNLELNPFLPLIALSLFESFSLLEKGCFKLAECVSELQANKDTFNKLKYDDSVVLYAFSTIVGYEKAKDVYVSFKGRKTSFYDFLIEQGLVSEKEISDALTPENLLKMGF